jgi:hypothetical protein
VLYHPLLDLYEPAHQICLAAIKEKVIHVDKLLEQCLEQIKVNNVPAAELLVLIKGLLSPAQQRLIGEKSLAIYHNLENDSLRAAASRVLGQYHNYIENLDVSKITRRLCNFVFDTYSTQPKYKSLIENQSAIILLENMTPMIDDKTRKSLLEFLYRNVTAPYVKRLIVPLIEDTLDKQNRDNFTIYVSKAISKDVFHLYNDDRDVAIKSLSLGRLIQDINSHIPAHSQGHEPAPAQLSSRPS